MAVSYPAAARREANRCMASGGIHSPWTRTTRRAAAGVPAGSAADSSGGFLSADIAAPGERAAQDELAVARAADREEVFADPLEAATGVEALGTEVLRPHADPQRARTVTLEPCHHGI